MAIPEQRSGGLGGLLHALVDNTALLFRQEAALFKAELGATLKTTAINSVALIAGGVLALIGLFWLVMALVLGLATVWPGWLAALVVGGVIVLLGLVLVLIGVRSLMNVSPAPERTIRTMESNLEMVKEKV